MPYLNVKISQPSTSALAGRIAGLLADLTTDILHKKRELTSISVEGIAAEQWFVGGAAVAAQGVNTFYLEIRVTEGTNTKDEKARYVRAVFEAMQSILGALHPASYVVIKEVRADAWGYQGATQEYRYIQGKAL